MFFTNLLIAVMSTDIFQTQIPFLRFLAQLVHHQDNATPLKMDA